MNMGSRGIARACTVLLVLSTFGLVATPASAATVPTAPLELELIAGSDLSITIEWPAVADATSYNIYRGTSSGGEGATPIGSTTDTEYKDTNLSSTPVSFYQVTAVNSAGESPRSAEDASKTPPGRHRRRRGRRQRQGLLLQGRTARRIRMVPDTQWLVPFGAGLIRLRLPPVTGSSTWHTRPRAR